MNRRMAMLTGSLALLLATTAIWSYYVMVDRRTDAMNAQRDLGRCRIWAGRIAELRNRPAMAQDRQHLDAQTNLLVEQAAAAAQIPAENLLGIRHEPPRWVGDSSYKEKPVRLLLQKVTLQQVVRLVHGLSAGQASLRPKSLRLSIPKSDDTGNQWSADIVLTYLIYEVRRQP